MPEPYSLARRAWLPVALDDGRRAFVRPCDIASRMDGHAVIRIASGRPDCDTALTELLIGLLAVALPPTSRRDWRRRFDNPPSAEDLQAAFAPFERALILDGDGPRFFQDLEDLVGERNGIDALFIDAPGGKTLDENADHFVKRGRTAVLSRAGAAIALATLQTCAPSGGAGHRTSLRGGGPLTTLVFPGAKDGEPDLWRRLWTNVSVQTSDEPAGAERIFPWLVKTRVSDKSGVTTTPDDVDPLQAFFGMPRRIRLAFEPNVAQRPCDLLGIVDEVVATGYVTRPWGTNYTAWTRRHPLSPYYKLKPDDAEFLPLHLQSARVGYRQWLGMVLETEGGGRTPAQCVAEFAGRAHDFNGDDGVVRREARLLVTGYVLDNMKALDFAEAFLPLIVTGDPGCDDAVRDLARRWIDGADRVASQLGSSVKRALFGEAAKVDRDNTVLGAVRSRFWADTDFDFYAKLREAADSIEARNSALAEHLDPIFRSESLDWLKILRRVAFAIFDDLASIDDSDADRIQDVIAARTMLGLTLSGYGKGGGPLFERLHQPPVQTKPKKGGKKP